MGSEMSFCTCSLIKSTSCEGGIQTERGTKREKQQQQFSKRGECDRFFGQLILKVCKLKYLEAFKGYKHSAASHHSRILKWNSCSDSLWFNAVADDTDWWKLTQDKEVGLLLTSSGYY